MIDYVFPYVNCSDSVWRHQYRQTFGTMRMDESRYRPFGTLRYVFRSVEKNLPFVDRVVMIVSTESQVPDWVNRDKVRIVTHDEFMPEKHRPTFSSSAIESDMWRIGGLSDRFLYANDDLFTLHPLTEDDFFCDGFPRLSFAESDYHHKNVYRISCRNGMDMVADALGADRNDQWTLLKPQHCTKGILTSHMKEVGRLCEGMIEQTITPMRHQTNVTGFIYNYYAYYTCEYAPFDLNYKFITITNSVSNAIREIGNVDTDILCMNDSGELSRERYGDACLMLKDGFERLFPERCSYELS